MRLNKLLLCFFLWVNVCGCLYAQASRPKVGLALSGGGAKGVAHIGVLKVMEEVGIPVDYISGASMGSIIGGLYAIGYDAATLDSLVRSQDWMFLLTDQMEREFRSLESKQEKDRFLVSFPFSIHQQSGTSLSGFIKGQNILNKFTDLTIGYHQVSSFDSLPIPFACVAGDLRKGDEVIIKEGSLPLAMRSSMAIPGVFAPVYRDSMVLIDGGVFNNFPTDVVKKMGADVVIGIDLNTDALENPEYKSLMEIANKLIFIAGEKKYAENMKLVDLYINPELKGYGSADFNAEAIDSMIVMGERAARAKWNELVALKKRLNLPDKKDVERKTMAAPDSFWVAEVQIKGLKSFDEEWIMKQAGVTPEGYLNADELERSVRLLQGTGLFKSVGYSLTGPRNDVLVFRVQEFPEGRFDIGFNVNSEEIASLLLHARMNVKSLNSSSVDATAKISTNPWLNVDYSFHTRKMKNIGVAYRLGYTDMKLYREGRRIDNISFLGNHIEFYLNESSYRNFTYRVGVQGDFFCNASGLYTPDYRKYVPKSADRYFSTFLMLGYDSFDNLTHPASGVRLAVKDNVYGDDVFKEKSNWFNLTTFNFQAALSLSNRFCVLPEVYGSLLWGDGIPGYFQNYIGGEDSGRYFAQQQLFYGIRYAEVADNLLLGSRLTLRYRIGGKHYVSGIVNYAYNTHDFNSFSDGKSYWGGALKYSYDTLIGPVSLTFDYSNSVDKLGIYANVGYYF